MNPSKSLTSSLSTKNVISSILTTSSLSDCSSRTILNTGPPQPTPARFILMSNFSTPFSCRKDLNSV
ncbi:hypothetical protein ABE450_002512 [Clostridium perfringens]|nr:hypothetical protein [Clostridium perfringens]EJT6136740.1 hypothetical protein [Clostridium perfringens]EJT6151807.1 hypothetical protein [Clostridium perfringens]EJT6157481.1 hypothetical protein [Clostridium perfringens]MBP2860653.1 hypothetical protein [Clostridium perfringens]